MDSPVAKILAVHGGRAIVSVDAGSVCPRCAAGKGCGAGLMTGSVRNREIEVSAGPDLQLVVGDQVFLAMPDADLLRAAFFAYGLPLAGTVVALTITGLVVSPLHDAAAVSIAAAGLFLGWLGGRHILRRKRYRRLFQPEIVVRREPMT